MSQVVVTLTVTKRVVYSVQDSLDEGNLNVVDIQGLSDLSAVLEDDSPLQELFDEELVEYDYTVEVIDG